MPANYVLLERIELNASAASVTFANIPQTGYTDLKVVASVRTSNASGTIGAFMQFNGLATNIYSGKAISGNGASASSYSPSNSSPYSGVTGDMNANSYTANTFSHAEFYIPNYTSSNNKSYSVDGVTRIIKSGSLAMGNTHEFSRDATKVGGVAQAFNAKISPVLTLVVQSGSLATQDFHDAILSNAELANGVTLNFDGYSFVFDGVQVTDRQDGADGTVMGETITLVFNQNISIKLIQEA
jgi:hypothetical protein